MFILDRWEAEGGAHVELFSTWELLDYPDHARFVWHIFNSAHIGLEYRGVNINRYWHDNLHIICDGFLLELGAGLDDVLDFALGEILNGGCAFNQRFNMGVNAVRHQFEFTIRWYEGDQALRIKFI